MCATYRPTSRDRVREFLRVDQNNQMADGVSGGTDDVYPGQVAPVIRLRADGSAGSPALELIDAIFGMVPPWSRDGRNYRHTYNARTETVADKPSFRNAWRSRQFCAVPMQLFYEPNYESGAAVRWKIERRDGEPLWIGGLWENWRDQHGVDRPSFTMLTLNAGQHVVMNRFHAPADEKRMLVMLALGDVNAWLQATNDEARDLFGSYQADALATQAAPKPPRRSPRPSPPSSRPPLRDLFDE